MFKTTDVYGNRETQTVYIPLLTNALHHSRLFPWAFAKLALNKLRLILSNIPFCSRYVARLHEKDQM